MREVEVSCRHFREPRVGCWSVIGFMVWGVVGRRFG